MEGTLLGPGYGCNRKKGSNSGRENCTFLRLIHAVSIWRHKEFLLSFFFFFQSAPQSTGCFPMYYDFNIPYPRDPEREDLDRLNAILERVQSSKSDGINSLAKANEYL